MSEFVVLPGESVGQNEPRWNRLRGLIDSYPKDSGILKELIQNADDGQARNVRIILDERQHSNISVPHPELHNVLGPAIIAFNDAPFQEQDFSNLANLANSAKIEDAFKTGRFGLGFNSVYNITDYPILLTRDKLWCLDPCETLFKDPRGGQRWLLTDLLSRNMDGVLSLFADVGYEQSSDEFSATAFRLPLRNDGHIRMNQDPECEGSRARISANPFTSKDFEDVVDGLSGIAHELLLFLKNVESVTCSRITPDGVHKMMLSICITNFDEVRRGRERINAHLRNGIETTLNECQTATKGCIESCYEIGIEVTLESGTKESTLWQIASGLYAGEGNCLIEASKMLGKVDERGLPHVGVAVCILQGNTIFPRTDGKVFCYLPIADKDYSGKLPLHIHGAFSLDASRTSLSGHREDEHAKQELRARWNDLLLQDGVATAYATALSLLAKFTPERINHQQLAEAVYRLFPSEFKSLPSHLSLLARASILKLTQAPIFLSSQQSWCSASELLDVPESSELEKCLAIEGFSFPSPRLPSAVRSALSSLNALPPALEAAQIKMHFFTDIAATYKVEEHPFSGLRSEGGIWALVQFLIDRHASDWLGLPIALCEDGYCHTVNQQTPILIGTDRQRCILALAPEHLATARLSTMLETFHPLPTGFSPAHADNWLPIVREKLMVPEGEVLFLHPPGNGLPNTNWLQHVFEELCTIEENHRPEGEVIDTVPIIPDSHQRLHLPGNAETPLLLQIADKGFVPLLDALRIDYFILSPQDKLTKCLTSFRDEYERVWSLTPPDLIDSLHAKLADIESARGQWANQSIVDPLLRFLDSKWEEEERTKDKERLERLNLLPFFEDQNGDFGPISSNCFRAGSFPLPQSINGLRLIRNDSWDRLLQSMGLHTLTRQTLLLNWVLPNYLSHGKEVQLDWLRWIRDEWNRLVGEMGGSEEMAGLIGESELIRTHLNTVQSIRVCYHPNSRELVESILGDTVPFPDMSYYKDEPALWLSFFESCGIQYSPRVQDLSHYIDKLLNESDGKGLRESTSNAMTRVAKHIFSHWSELREKTIILPDQNQVSFCEYLSKKPWLPAANGRDLDRFIVGSDPDSRFFRPDELYLFAAGYLVSSNRPLLVSSLSSGLTSDIISELGIHSSPDWPEVADHFETLLEELGAGPFEPEKMRVIKTTFEAIYRYFGQSPDRFLGTDDAPVESNPVQERFSYVPCILVEKERCLRCPSDVYKTITRNLAPLKCVGKFNDPTLDKGLEVLGRADQPGVEDLAEALTDLRSEHPEPIDILHQKSVNRILALLTELLSDITEDQELPSIVVMNEEGRLVSPGEVIYSDDPWLASELRIPPKLLLHNDTPARVVHLWDMPSLRQATDIPIRIEQKVSSGFAKQCEVLADLLRSDEFQTGLCRITYHQNGRHPEDTFLKRLHLQPCSGLSCRYTIKLEDQDVELGEATADFHFNAELEGGTILISQDCQDVLHERLADCLCRILGEDGPEDKAALVTILQRSPELIQSTLNRLRITDLPTRCEMADTEVDDGDLFETMGEHNELDEAIKEAPPVDFDKADDPNNGISEDEEANSGPIDDEGLNGWDDEEDSDQRLDRSNTQTIPSGQNDRGRATSGSGLGSLNSKGIHGTGRRGRMLPGRNRRDSGIAEVGRNSPRRNRVQGERWTSYAITKDQMESNRSEDDSNDDESPRSHFIARSAVAFVMQYERSQGRKPQNMAQGNPGYDVESMQGSAIERYIEVKGIDAEWGKRGVPLSPLQLNCAQGLGDMFWLYVVENCTETESTRLHMIQNPAAKITQFNFDSGWKQAGKEASSFQILEPRVGWTLVEHDNDVVRQGKIIEVSPSGNTIFLKVRFDGGAPACSIIYDPISMQIRET